VRILIVGGTGFIGSRVVRLLAAAGHNVAVFHRGKTLAEAPAGVEQIVGERDCLLEHTADLRRFAPQVVIHLIAYVETHARQMLEVFRGVAERAVLVSSGDVYRSYGVFHGTESGPLEPVAVKEDGPLRSALYPYRSLAKAPDDFVYSYDKIPVERAGQSDPGLPCTVLRLPMVYGPGDPQRRLAGYLQRMTDGRPAIPLDETLATWRCTRGFVDDISAAIALATTDSRSAGRTFNVGEFNARRESDWVQAIASVVGWRGAVVAVPSGSLSVAGNYKQHVVVDTSSIRAELGYREIVSCEDALARTVRWELTQRPAAAPIDYAAEDGVLARVLH
jgi:nucleoside-diphosphate-sugar epimerase